MSENNIDNKVPTGRIFLPPFKLVLTGIILLFLIIALLSGATYKFYASFLFLFYGLIKRMWISVICLGIFQTLIMIPFRIINLRQTIHIKEFQDEIDKIQTKKGQRSLFKKTIRKGDSTLLWYLINFAVQTISYFSLGRLFLTDFYSQPLNPKLLYSFISYPQYPIQDTFFKIPYTIFTKTIDLGMDKVWIFWAIILVYKFVIVRFINYYRKRTDRFKYHLQEEQFPFSLIKKIIKYTNGSVIFFMFLGWIIIRNFPMKWELRIFSGDVSKPNSTFNMITAITTFFIVLWLDLPKIAQKVKIIKLKNISQNIMSKIKVKLLKNSLQKAVFLGLGAYFITNLIPCAFELSIFTLEMISIFSPLTLDRAIFKIQERTRSKN